MPLVSYDSSDSDDEPRSATISAAPVSEPVARVIAKTEDNSAPREASASERQDVLGSRYKPAFDGTLTPLGSNTEIKTTMVTAAARPAGNADLSVMMRLTDKMPSRTPDTPLPHSVNSPLVAAPLAPKTRRPSELVGPPSKVPRKETDTFNANNFYNIENITSSNEDTRVYAIGAGRHQLSSLIRNAVENQDALQDTFSQRRNKTGRSKR